MKQNGFSVSSFSIHEYPVSLDMNWWITMIRNRFWSTFSEFDDDNIEKGITEIQEKFGQSSFVNFSEKYVSIVAQK